MNHDNHSRKKKITLFFFDIGSNVGRNGLRKISETLKKKVLDIFIILSK
jgi:hypothetical protein